jgi:hypothetical protein
VRVCGVWGVLCEAAGSAGRWADEGAAVPVLEQGERLYYVPDEAVGVSELPAERGSVQGAIWRAHGDRRYAVSGGEGDSAGAGGDARGRRRWQKRE